MYHDNGRELIDRLVKCGYSEYSATDICQKYAALKKFDELEKFIKENEFLADIGMEL